MGNWNSYNRGRERRDMGVSPKSCLHTGHVSSSSSSSCLDVGVGGGMNNRRRRVGVGYGITKNAKSALTKTQSLPLTPSLSRSRSRSQSQSRSAHRLSRFYSSHSGDYAEENTAMISPVAMDGIGVGEEDSPTTCRNMLNLPNELILLVLKLLSLKELLYVRMTCKFLANLSSTRTVWLNMYNAYALRHSSAFLEPERPIGMYTDRELERWITVRVSAEEGWLECGPSAEFTRNDWGNGSGSEDVNASGSEDIATGVRGRETSTLCSVSRRARARFIIDDEIYDPSRPTGIRSESNRGTPAREEGAVPSGPTRIRIVPRTIEEDEAPPSACTTTLSLSLSLHCARRKRRPSSSPQARTGTGAGAKKKQKRWSNAASPSIGGNGTGMCLVPGGRWLLIGGEHGEVYCCDLEPSVGGDGPRAGDEEGFANTNMSTPSPTRVPVDNPGGHHDGQLRVTKVIEPENEMDRQKVCGMAVYMENEDWLESSPPESGGGEQSLCFCLGLSLWTFSGAEGPDIKVPRARFWRLMLTNGDVDISRTSTRATGTSSSKQSPEIHDTGADNTEVSEHPSATGKQGLKSHYLNSFQTPRLGYILPTCLRGEMFAQVVCHVTEMYIEVFKWRRCTDEWHVRSVIWPRSKPHKMEILSDTQLLVFAYDGLLVYEIPALEWVPASAVPSRPLGTEVIEIPKHSFEIVLARRTRCAKDNSTVLQLIQTHPGRAPHLEHQHPHQHHHHNHGSGTSSLSPSASPSTSYSHPHRIVPADYQLPYPPDIVTRPLWNVKCRAWPVMRGDVSRVWKHEEEDGSGSLRCVVALHDGVYGLVIPWESIDASGSGDSGERGGDAPRDSSLIPISTTTPSRDSNLPLVIYGEAPKLRMAKLLDMKYSPESVCVVGRFKGFVRQGDEKCLALTYFWGRGWSEDDEDDGDSDGCQDRQHALVREMPTPLVPASQITSVHGLDLDEDSLRPELVRRKERMYPGGLSLDPPLWDEQSGRLVQWMGHNLVVLDSALCYSQGTGSS